MLKFLSFYIILLLSNTFIAQLNYEDFILKKEPNLNLIRERASYVRDSINNKNKIIDMKFYNENGFVIKQDLYQNYKVIRTNKYVYEGLLLKEKNVTYLDSNGLKLKSSKIDYFYNKCNKETLKIEAKFRNETIDSSKSTYSYIDNQRIEKYYVKDASLGDSLFNLRYKKITKYNKKNVVSYEYYDRNNQIFEKRLYEYTKGNLSKILNYRYGKLDLIEEFHYEGNSLVSATFQYNSLTEDISKQVYNYNKSSGLLVGIKFFVADILFAETIYTYNQKNHLISEINKSYDEKGKEEDLTNLYYHILYK